jgi:ketol-acid reductoisomerase
MRRWNAARCGQFAGASVNSRCPWVDSGRVRDAAAKHPIEQVDRKLRYMMPWIAKNKLVDAA